jgi:hypothetical protein
MVRANRRATRRLFLVAALCCVGLLGVTSAALAATQTLTTDVLYQGTHYTHTYTITVNPCNGSFTGTGSYDTSPTNETITGTISGGSISGTSTYGNGYSYSFSGPVDSSGNFTGGGSDSIGQTFDSVSGTGATVPGGAKPGNGYGDKNHTHCGPPGQNK